MAFTTGEKWRDWLIGRCLTAADQTPSMWTPSHDLPQVSVRLLKIDRHFDVEKAVAKRASRPATNLYTAQFSRA